MDTAQAIKRKNPPVTKKRAFLVGMIFQLIFLALVIAVIAIAYTVQKTQQVAEKAEATAKVNTKPSQLILKQNTIDLKTAKDLATKVTDEKVEAAKKELEVKIGVTQDKAARVNRRFEKHQINANVFRESTIRFKEHVKRELGGKGE